MPKSVAIDELIPTLLADLEHSSLAIQQKAVKVTEETSSEMSVYAQTKVPVSKGKGVGGHHLKDAISVTPSSYNQGLSAKFYVSATKWHKYSIVHLLELGHLKPFGVGFVHSIPFMKPSLEKYKTILDSRISSILDSGGK